MSSHASGRRQGRRENAVIPNDTLHMLGAALKTAFRMHCTGETVGGKTAWQIVNDVQRKLADLAPSSGRLVSEDCLAEYVENDLPVSDLKLAQVA
jgi:hypothetical protein